MAEDISAGARLICTAAEHYRVGQHVQGAQALEQLQATPSPLIVSVCRAVLDDAASSVYSCFYACRVLRSAIIRDWAAYWGCAEPAGQVSEYARGFIVGRAAQLSQPASKALLSEMCLLFAVEWKLRVGGADTGMPALVRQLANELLSLGGAADATASEAPRVVVRALWLSAIEEFGLFHPDSQARGMALARHDACRRAFCQHALPQLCAEAVARLAQGTANGETPLSATRLLHVLYAVFCWRFDASIEAANAGERIPEQLSLDGPAWRALLLQPTQPVEAVLRGWHNVFAGNAEARLVVRQTLVQLCSVCGTDWAPPERAAYAARCAAVVFELAAEALRLQPGAAERGSEVQACALAAQRLVNCGGVATGVLATAAGAAAFVPQLTAFTHHVIEATGVGIADAEEAECMREALDNLLRCWLCLVTQGLADISSRVQLEAISCADPSTGAPTTVAAVVGAGAAAALRSFVECRMRGAAGAPAADAAPDEPHAEEYTQSHLQVVGLLGREQPAVVAQFLAASLTTRGAEYAALLAARRLPPQSFNEALWCVLSVAANFVGDADDAERPSIPISIVDSISAVAASSVPAVLELVRVVCDFAAHLLPALGTGLVSPGVCEALLDFFRRVAASYVFPELEPCDDFPAVFAHAVGGSGYTGFADRLLQFAVASARAFPLDDDVLGACSLALRALVGKPAEFGAALMALSSYAGVVQLAATGDGASALPGATRGRFFGVVVSLCPDPGQTLAAVVAPVAAQISGVLASAADGAEQRVPLNLVVAAVETLDGAFQSLRGPEQTRSVFSTLLPLLDAAIGTLHRHARHKPLLAAVLRMLESAVSGCCAFLPGASFVLLVQRALETVRIAGAAMRDAASHAPVGRSREEASQDEDERVAVLVEATRLTTTIATWGLMDFTDDPDADAARADAISALAVSGLLTVLTFVDKSLLHIPALRDGVFGLLQEVATTYTSRFLAVDAVDAAKLLAATDFAVSASVPELRRSGFKVIECIAAHQRDHGDRAAPPNPLLGQFLSCVASVIASGRCDSAVVPAVAGALFALGGVFGPAATTEACRAAMQSSVLLERPFQQLAQMLGSTDFSSTRREAKKNFATGVETVMSIVKGTIIS